MDCGFDIDTQTAGSGAFQQIDFQAPGFSRRRALNAQRVARIGQYVDKHIDDPDLSAQTTARALGMSVRSLHLALAGSSRSFGELVTARRLERVRGQLTQWHGTESVADLAFGCGFNSLSSFYRAFRRHFGTCPRAVRAAG